MARKENILKRANKAFDNVTYKNQERLESSKNPLLSKLIFIAIFAVAVVCLYFLL